MNENKAYLRQKFIEFQLKIAELNHDLSEQRKGFEKKQKDFYLGLFDILDAFENIEETIETKKDQMEKSVGMLMKNISTIHKKLVRLLKAHHIAPMVFDDNKARRDQCKIVDTRPEPGIADETILKIVKNGYIDASNGAILRKAEVITVVHEKLAVTN